MVHLACLWLPVNPEPDGSNLAQIEGAEMLVLKDFPFDRYRFRLLTVEHNEPHERSGVVPKGYRKALRKLLESNGYVFVTGNDDLIGIGAPIEDWYRLRGEEAEQATPKQKEEL